MCISMFHATAMNNSLACSHIVLFQTQQDIMRLIKGVSNTAKAVDTHSKHTNAVLEQALESREQLCLSIQLLYPCSFMSKRLGAS